MSDLLVFVMNRVAEFCMCWSFCIWTREVVFIGTVGKVRVGIIIVLHSLSLLCVLKFLQFCQFGFGGKCEE